MILPKELFDQIEYFEHTVVHESHAKPVKIYDVFVLHFKQWYRVKRTIKILREIEYLENGHSYIDHVSPSAADLYNQLNQYALSTFEEKLDSVKQKYVKHEDNDNVLVLKPKPKDMDE